MDLDALFGELLDRATRMRRRMTRLILAAGVGLGSLGAYGFFALVVRPGRVGERFALVAVGGAFVAIFAVVSAIGVLIARRRVEAELGAWIDQAERSAELEKGELDYLRRMLLGGSPGQSARTQDDERGDDLDDDAEGDGTPGVG